MSPFSSLLKEILSASLSGLTQAPGRSVLIPGSASAWDDCCEGQLALRVVDIQQQGASGQAVQANCPLPWRVTLGLQIVRCISVVDDGGVAPSAFQITQDGVGAADDALELYQALTCNVAELQGVAKLVIQRWTPSGAQGGCAGGEWIFSITWLGCGGC